MKRNMGSVDRIVRGVVGVALIAWALRGGPVWAWVGVLPLATSILGFCPGYLPFGISTLKSRK